MEKRPDSDVEFSVYYDPGEEVENRELLHLAVTCWNRMARFCHKNGLPFELQKHLLEDEHWVLGVNDVKAQLENTYLPVIDLGTLLRTDLRRNATVRNRYYQVLTELRPVFNPGLVFRLKQRMLKNDGALPNNLGAIAASPHLKAIFAQFATDTEPEELDDWKQLKRFTSRFMNVLACRLALLRELRLSQALDTDAQWQTLFDSLTEPGVVKVARFGNLVRNPASRIRDRGMLEEALNAVIAQYLELLSRYNRLPDNASDQEAKAEIKDLKQVAKHVAGRFFDLLERIGKEEAFKAILTRSEWLVDTTSVKETAKLF
jgi:hypothetical protein